MSQKRGKGDKNREKRMDPRLGREAARRLSAIIDIRLYQKVFG
jgi:hypothetical protein